MRRDEEPDEQLLRAFVGGDRPSFDVLVRRHEDRIFSLALRITGDRGDAFDATQDTFVALFKRATTFRGDAAFATWLYRIGINAARDVVRRKRRVPTTLGEVEDEPATTPAVDETVPQRLAIVTALQALPDDYREAVALHDLAGLPYDEIATLTGVALGTVKSRISRGRRRLAELLEQPPAREASNS